MKGGETAPPLPQNLDAERAVLGAILLDNSCLKNAREQLVAEDFFLQFHHHIFRAMAAMEDAGKPIDLVMLVDELTRRDRLEASGGPPYVASLLDGMPRVSNVEHYARIVKESAIRRRLIREADVVQSAAFDLTTPLEQLAARVSSLTCPMSASRPSKIEFISSRDFLERRAGDEAEWLAEKLLPASSQILWQGRPKVGKSHSLLQLAFDLACGLPSLDHFAVRHAVRTAFMEPEEPEAITKGRFAAMLRAHGGQGPDSHNLTFFTREELRRLRVLPRELLGVHLKDFIAALRDRGIEFLVLVALRRFLAPGENIKDPEVAERLNDALDTILNETGAAIALANHNRKERADTIEAQGFGSTFVSARADGTFDLERAKGGLRRVRIEARFDAPEQFFLRKNTVGDGELIRWCEAPNDPKQAKREELVQRVAGGESVAKAAKDVGIEYSTATRWVREEKEE